MLMRYAISLITVAAIAGLPAIGSMGQEGAGQLWARPAIPGHFFAAEISSDLTPLPVQGDGKSSETIANIPFDKCRELMDTKIADLKADPMGIISIVNTGFMKIIRVCTDPGDVLLTCSEAEQWLVITTSQLSADRRCK